MKIRDHVRNGRDPLIRKGTATSSPIPESDFVPARAIVIDPDFRPVSYADAPDPVSAILQNLMGPVYPELRRYYARRILAYAVLNHIEYA